MAHQSYATDVDQLRALGHGALGLVNAAILLAVVAVILSANSQSAGVIQAFFALLSWLVGQVIRPITGGVNVNLIATPAVSGGYQGVTAGSGGGSGGSGATTGGGALGTLGAVGTGAGSGTLPAGWSSSYVPGYTYGAQTQADGSVVYGYHPPGA